MSIYIYKSESVYLLPSVRTWYKTKGCCASECVTIIIKTLFTWNYWIFRFRNAILETVHAFCCFCGRGGLFYGASFVICLQGCCCKVRVIYSGEKKKEKQVLLSARFHLHKLRRCTNRCWPAAIPPWIIFLYQSACLSALPFTLILPPPQCRHTEARDVVFRL